MNKLNYFTARLAERSTWIGLVGLLSVFGISLAPDYQEPVITTGVTLASLISMLTRDKAK